MDALIVFCAQYLVLFVVIALAVAWLRVSKQQKILFIGTVVLAGIIALVLSRIAGHLYFHPRPFVSQHTIPLISHAADNGFPSDHALFTMTLTAAAYFFSKKIAATMLALTVVVSVARVAADVHSPLDIAGGWIIGIIAGVAAFYASQYLLKKIISADKNT